MNDPAALSGFPDLVFLWQHVILSEFFLKFWYEVLKNKVVRL